MGSLLAAIDVHILAGTADRGAVLKICGTSCLWATRAFSVVDPSLLFALGFFVCVCCATRSCSRGISYIVVKISQMGQDAAST